MSFISFGLWVIVGGIVLLTCEVNCLRGSALVAELKAKAKAALLNPTEVVPVEELLGVDGDDALNGTLTNSTEVANKTRSLLTGNPQKDYIYDPNLPRELNGYNLSSYPFYNGVPEDIDFKCDDLHDGFYASVPHKCQVYHHCLFGTRYDFLCANYTAFDQKTFICHFVSEVDCDNSPKYFQRNEALYKAASTSAPIPQTPRQTTLPPTTTAQPLTQRPRRRRPYRRRRPVYEYYYDDQYDDEEYYDDEPPPPPPPRRKMNRKHRPQGGYRDEGADYFDGRRDSSRDERLRPENFKGGDGRGEGSRGESRGGGSGDSSQESKATLRISGPATGTVYDRPRVPPKIRRPVPIHERDKYDYTPKSSDGNATPSQTSTKNKQQQEEDEDEYYDEEYEDDYVKPPPKRGKAGNEYSMESNGKGESRRANNRQKSRQQPRRRPDRFEDEYEDDRPMRPSKRPRHEEIPQSGRGNRGIYRSYSREEPNPVPADRPGFISSGRFASGNRKRADDDRSQTSTKKQYSRVVYDDDEEEEEYYDDDDDIHEDEGNRRNPVHSSNGRRVDYDEPDRRKQTNSSRKQTSENKSNNPSSRSEERPQSNIRVQGGFLRTENRKLLSSKQKPEEPSFRRNDKEDQCRNDCEDEYSEELGSDLKQNQRKTSSRDNNEKQASELAIQSQVSERDRLFSSRFRDNQRESKIKQQNYEPLSRTSVSPSNLETTTQYPEPLQRYKPSVRMKPTSEESPMNHKVTTTSSYSLEDYSDESLTSKYSNFRSKGRVIPPTPLINNYKLETTTGNIYEPAELSDSGSKTELKSAASNESEYSTADKPLYPPRHFGIARRPFKQSTESAITTEMAVNTATSDSKTQGFIHRQQSTVDEENDSSEQRESVKKPITSSQNYRRIKPEPLQNENIEYYQPKVLSTGSNFRKPSKLYETTLEETPFSRDTKEETSNVDITKAGKPSTGDKSQLGNSNYGGVYRRVKISAISNPVTELEVSTSSNENPRTVDEFSISNPVNINKRPYVVVRPLINNPVVVDDNSKNILPPNTPFRRPLKQRVQDTNIPLTSEDYSSPSINEGISDIQSNPDPTIGKLRESYGYFTPKRGKIRIDDNSARGLVQFPKQIPLNEDNQYTKHLPKLEITAPGPSAPDLDIATVKSNYNNGPASFSLDIPDEEYDVTLNDALQPSTLHPTRSLADYQQTRLKPREYQSNSGRNSEYINRGRVSYLLSAASQQVQSVLVPEAARGLKKDMEEYEAVVLTSPGDRWTTQHRSRPTEIYW